MASRLGGSIGQYDGRIRSVTQGIWTRGSGGGKTGRSFSGGLRGSRASSSAQLRTSVFDIEAWAQTYVVLCLHPFA
jgi:hypothetical protein